jgi:hypothetical protein
MVAAEKIDAEIARLDAVLARRGAFHEDEQVERDTFVRVRNWLKEDKEEAERIELEALAAEEFAEEQRKKADPNYQTRKLFEGVRINVPGKDKRR